MCRFSAHTAVPAEPESPGLEQLLDNDAFDWFACLDDLPEEQLPAMELPVAMASDSNSTGGSEAVAVQADLQVSASANNCATQCGSDGSSYNLLQILKQPAEQDAAGSALPRAVASYDPTPVAAQDRSMQFGLCAVPEVKVAPFRSMAGVCVAPPRSAATGACTLASPAAGPCYSSMSSGLNVFSTPCLGLESSGVSAVARKSGSKHQRSQAEIEAAVERIKQKRRESAQRSRARKNDYMRQLEVENQGLKDEVHRLQQLLTQMQRGVAMVHQQQHQQVLQPMLV